MSDKKIKFLGITVYRNTSKNGIKKKFLLGICYSKKKSKEGLNKEQTIQKVSITKDKEWYKIVDGAKKDITLSSHQKYKNTIPSLPDDRQAHIFLNMDELLRQRAEIKRIALVFFMGIGDYFYATNFIALLKNKYPQLGLDAYVSKNTDRNNSPLVFYCLKNNPNIDNVYYFDGLPNYRNWKNYDYSDVLGKVKKGTFVLPVIYEYNSSVTSRTATLCKTFGLPIPEFIDAPIIYPNKETSNEAFVVFNAIRNCYKISNRKIVYMQLASRSLSYTYGETDKLINLFLSKNYIVVTAEANNVESPYLFTIDTQKMNINDSIELLRLLKIHEAPIFCLGIISCFASISSGLNIPNLIIQASYDKQIQSIYFPNHFILSNRHYETLPSERFFIAPKDTYYEIKNPSGLTLQVYKPDYIFKCFTKMVECISPKYNDKLGIEKQSIISTIIDTKWFMEENNPKHVLIIKTDHIGDYFLFRNFLKEIKKTKKYKDCIIHFIGNEIFQEVSELLDSSVIDKAFWTKHKLPSQGFSFIDKTRERLFAEGMLKKYDLIFIPSFNRSYFEECYLRLIQGIQYKELICNDGDVCSKQSPSTKYNGLYTRIIHLPRCYEIFEFDMNKKLFEETAEEKILLDSPYIDMDFQDIKNENYILVQLCSRNMENRWHPYNYIRLVQWLKEKYHKKIYILGSHEDEEIYQEYSELLKGFVTPYFGKPWKSVINLIKNAALYIGPDSGCYHIAAMLKTKAVIISRGAALYRFNKYPPTKNLITVLPEGIEEEICAAQKKDETAIKTIYTSTNLVSVNAVKKAIEKIMEKS